MTGHWHEKARELFFTATRRWPEDVKNGMAVVAVIESALVQAELDGINQGNRALREMAANAMEAK